MSQNADPYYYAQASGPGWQQPGYLRPPQNLNQPYSHQNVGPPSFTPQNQGSQFTQQNQGPAYPQNLGSSCRPSQNQFPSQNQGPCYPTQNQGPAFPPQNEGPRFHPQNQGPACPLQNRGPPILPLNQAPVLLPQNHCPGFMSQNQSPPVNSQNQIAQFPPQNQRPSFPSQNQGPLFPVQNPCPLQNQGPLFPLQNQGPPIPQQNQVPLGPPQNHMFSLQNKSPQCPQSQRPVYPQNQGFQGPQNQGLPYPQRQGSVGSQNHRPAYAQNQNPVGPQNQSPACTILNPGPPIPPQNQHPPFAIQNQGPMCPPQNQSPIFPSQNQGPKFFPQNQNNRPLLPENNGLSYTPCIRGPAYPQQNDNWVPLEEYPDNKERCKNYGDDWRNKNDDDWSNQNDDYEDDWKSQSSYRRKNKGFKPSTSDVRGRREDFFKTSFKKKNHKEDPLIKRSRMGPNKNSFQSNQSSQEQCSNNVLVNIVKTSSFDCYKTPQDSKLQKKNLDSFKFEIKQSLESSKRGSEGEYVCTKPKEHKFNLNANKKSVQNKHKQLQKTNQVQDDVTFRFKNIKNDSSSNSNSQNNNFTSKLSQKFFSQSHDQENDVDKNDFKLKQDKCNSKSNKTTLKYNENPTQKLNKYQDKEKQNRLESKKPDLGFYLNDQKDYKPSQVIQNSSTKTANEVKRDYVEPKLNYSCNVKGKNFWLEENNKESPPKNKAQTKRGLEYTKTNLSSTLNQDKSSLTSSLGQSQETRNVQQEKLDPVLSSNGVQDDKQSKTKKTSSKDSKGVRKHDNVDAKVTKLCSVKQNDILLQCSSEELPTINQAQAEKGLENTSNLNSPSNQKKTSPINNHEKSEKISNIQLVKLRSSKRLNSQNDNTFDDSTSVSAKRMKTGNEEQHSPSKVLAVDSGVKSKPETQDKIECTSLSDDKVKMNDTIMDQKSISQPTEKFEAISEIKIKKPDEVKPNATSNLSQVKETYSISNKIATCNTKVNQSSEVSQTNISMVENCKENPDLILTIITEPNDSIIKAGDVQNKDGKNNVKNKEALENKIRDHTESSSYIQVQNNTNSSDACGAAIDSSGNINSKQSQSNCNESTPDNTSQNSDLQTTYQSLNDDSQNSSDLSDGINPLEANLREFDILDEVEGSEDDGEQSTISSGQSDSGASDQEQCNVDVDDIDTKLEEGLPVNKTDIENKAPKKLRHKVILEEIGHNHFDLLPEGWIQINNNSGMPVYLEQKSRVCTMTRPYFLGPGSARSHKIPLSAVPCLQYKRALEIEKKYEEENRKKQTTEAQTKDKQPPMLPVITAKVETAEENEAAQSLDPNELQEYCKKVFSFKTISIIPFKSWGDRRKFARMTKDLKKQQRPLLPSDTKLLKFPIHNPDGTISKSKGEWVINPNGKSYVCILHEYVQHALKQHPKYQFKELKNPATPYSATVFIGEMQYGTGMGRSKKHAKLEAAKTALEVLIPEMKDKIERDSEFGMRSGITKRPQHYEYSIFDQIRIEDPRVAEFCAKTTEPPPYAILETCLQRNGMGLDEVNVEYNMNTKRHMEDEFKMTVRSHTAVVLCKNKRDGKQKAAQAILKALHPNIEYFGSLLRMYGNHSIKSVKEKKQEEQEITGLQCKDALNQPNHAILNELKRVMLKLEAKKKEQGKFHCQNALPTASTTDHNKINKSLLNCTNFCKCHLFSWN